MLLPVFEGALENLPSWIYQPPSAVPLPVLEVSLVQTPLLGYLHAPAMRLIGLVHLAHENVIRHESSF